MKSLCFFALSVLLLSCNQHQKQKIVIGKTGLDTVKASSSGLFSPAIQGVWVKSDYLKAIKRTKSPARSHSEIKGFSCLTIDPGKSKSDSLEIGISLSNHEGSQFTLYASKEVQKSIYKMNIPYYGNKKIFFLLGYKNTFEDTTLILYHYSKNNKLLEKTLYTKVLDQPGNQDVEYGIQYSVNKAIFAGSYICTDSAGNKQKITFSPEGLVSGFHSFRTYYIGTDFDETDASTADLIGFDIYERNRKKYFAFEVHGGTIHLFNYLTEDHGLRVVKTSLAYSLKRM